MKKITAIFRDVNLLEYKSPGDYVSVKDFYKVYGYACLYAYLEKASMECLTITFVESRYPRELLGHLKSRRGYKVEESSPGVYTVEGDILPIQVIDSRRLSEEGNFWLKGLSDDLKPPDMRRVFDGIHRQGKASRTKAWLDAVTRANIDSIEEAIKMSTTSLTLDRYLKMRVFTQGRKPDLRQNGKRKQNIKPLPSHET